jgi:type III restriction-modification system methyltransferase (adenine-specific)/adenine specific DNA methylase mod
MSDLKMHTANLVAKNIEKLTALFPNCITETRNEQGEIIKGVDFDLLRQELSEVLVEGEQERYTLNWVGKKESILAANAPIAKTLRPCREESVNFDTTENLFIEGDNLDALKLLQENYLGKVKMIYIDPPYNTGNDFIYNDDFAENTEEFLIRSSQVDDKGNRLIANPESNGRFHSDWLSMMYSRLKLAYNLLHNDGTLFISIDDNELSNLLKVLEAAALPNFKIVCVKMSEASGKKMATVKKQGGIPKIKEFIVIAQKSNSVRGLFFDEIQKKEWDSEYKIFLKNLSKNERELLRDTFYLNNISKEELDKIDRILSKIELSNISEEFKKSGNDNELEWLLENSWRICRTAASSSVLNLVEDKKKKHNVNQLTAVISSRDNLLYIAKTDYQSLKSPRVQMLFADDNLSVHIGDLWTDIKTTGLEAEGGVPFKNGKKPLFLIERLVKSCTQENDIVLDFFAGSATIADAVMRLNEKDGKHRRFICVQLTENLDISLQDLPNNDIKKSYQETIEFLDNINRPHTIAEISKERIRRAGSQILQNLDENKSLDVGFRVLKIDSSNMKDIYYQPEQYDKTMLDHMVSHIKEDRTAEDLLFQVMLDWGIELSLPIERKTIDGSEVYFVAGNTLVACFDKFTMNIVDEIAKVKPLRVVSTELAIMHDQDKTNIKERFKQLSPDTEVRFL